MTGYAIKLARIGDDAIVSVIGDDGVEAEVIRERFDGAFSHIVEPSGIAKRIASSRQGQSATQGEE